MAVPVVERAISVAEQVVQDLIGDPEGQIELGGREGRHAGEVLGCDADDREDPRVDADRATNQVRIRAVSVPVLVADDGDRDGAARQLLSWQEGTPAEEANAKRVEVVGRHDVGEDPACHLALGQPHEREVVGQQVAEHAPALTQVSVVGIREGAIAVGTFGALAIAVHQLVGPVDDEGSKEEPIDQTEDGGVDTDAQRQHEHGDAREPRVLRQHAGAVSDVLPQSVHEDPPLSITNVGAGAFATNSRTRRPQRTELAPNG